MAMDIHPAAPHHLPAFITAPGETDYLTVATGVLLVAAVLSVGLRFLRLHTLPERMAHPPYADGLNGVTPGSCCIANAYSSNHELTASGNISRARAMMLHPVDAVGLVHALLLRIQALVRPIRAPVFSDH